MSVEEVKQYYEENAQKEWDRLEQHPFEFLFTTYMLDQHIRPGDSVLDIGGGPGRYSLYYAEKGCPVTLLDLSQANTALSRDKAAERGVPLRTVTGSCLELDSLVDGQFDHVLLMGPLYHLTQRRDRETAVRLALSKLKPGGTFSCSFILSFAGLIYDLKNGPGFLPADLANQSVARLLESVEQGTEYTGPAFTSSCFVSQRQIEPFLAPFGLEKLHLFGQEGILALNENQVKQFPQEEYRMWVETAKQLLEVPELLALSEHAMYIGRKPE